MYAAIIQCDMRAIASFHERGRMGRTLATALGALPGFVAFVALNTDTNTNTDTSAGMVAALCIFEDLTSITAAKRVIARWHTEEIGTGGAGLVEVGAGAVIAQKGL